MNKIILFLSVLLTISVGVYAQDIEVAPLSPEFIQYLNLKQIYGDSLSDYNIRYSPDNSLGEYLLERNTSGYRNNEIPTPIDITTPVYENNRVTYPSSYDLRSYSRVTPIRDQDPWGTCWAFSSMASVESNYLTKYAGSTSAVNYSEMNLANKHGFVYGLNDGGHYFMSMAYFSRFNGPVNESDDPYKDPWTSPAVQPSTKAFVENVKILFSKATTSAATIDSATMNVIKGKIMEDGVVTVSYYSSSDYYSTKSNPKTFYCDQTLGTNHAVSIVGWDDNFSKSNFKITPEGNGAFLVRNSWGSSWGDSGYFWISYYDKTINKIASFEMDKDTSKYDGIYLHDFGGLVSAYSKTYKYARSVFTISKDVYLKAIGAFCYVGGAKYKAIVYVNGAKKAELTGDFTYPGYYTIPLSSEITLATGNILTIDINYNTANANLGSYVIPIEYNAPGYFTNGTYTAGTSYLSTDGINWWDVGQDKSYNTCIRALVNTKIIVTGVTVDPTKLSLGVGDTETLTATITPANATNKNITWKSSNTKVAIVDANGLVTAKSVGTATITATTVDGSKIASCAVSVTIPVTSISIKPATLTLAMGVSSTLKPTIEPTNATDKSVIWKSSNTNIATVDTAGKVTGIAAGDANITITTNSGNLTVTCKVTVVPAIVLVTSVSVSPTSLSLNIGSISTLTASVLPANATNKNILWSSSNTKIATVDSNGKVTAIAKGSATITAASSDGKKKAICKLTVTVPVDSVIVLPTIVNLAVGKTNTLKVTVLPTTADNKNVTWASSNTNVATVDTKGKITAKAFGTSTITVTTVDGNKKASCNVYTFIPVTSINISSKTLSVNIGASNTLSATVLPANATSKEVTWKSSNSKIATVNESGKVTGIAKGSATITVTSVEGSKTATCKVTVTIPVASVSVSPSTLSLSVGKTSILKATVLPSTAGNKSVTWKSSNTNIATVDSKGKVVAKAVGTATILVDTVDGNKRAICIVTVK